MIQYDTYFSIIVFFFYAIQHLTVLDIETLNPLAFLNSRLSPQITLHDPQNCSSIWIPDGCSFFNWSDDRPTVNRLQSWLPAALFLRVFIVCSPPHCCLCHATEAPPALKCEYSRQLVNVGHVQTLLLQGFSLFVWVNCCSFVRPTLDINLMFSTKTGASLCCSPLVQETSLCYMPYKNFPGFSSVGVYTAACNKSLLNFENRVGLF